MPEPATPRSVAITGANGFVGGILCRAFDAAGWHVIALQRSAPRDPRYDVIPFTLAGGPQRPLPAGLSCIVHCAYDLRARDARAVDRANVGGTEKLLAAADAAGVRNVVLISSMSAYAGTQQLYGRTKLRCEELVAAHGGTALRLGLVYGRDSTDSGGMVGSLQALAKLPIVPVLKPDSHQYTVAADDMARCVLAVAEHPPAGERVLGVANPRRVPFGEIMRRLHARSSTGKFRALGIPSRVIYLLLRGAEAVGVRLSFRSDSLLGLTRPAPNVPSVAYWAEHGIDLRDFS